MVFALNSSVNVKWKVKQKAVSRSPKLTVMPLLVYTCSVPLVSLLQYSFVSEQRPLLPLFLYTERDNEPFR